MIDYTLIRSARKTLAIEVSREGKVIVRAPRRAAKYHIDAFVEQHADWIATHQTRQRARAAAHPEPTDAERDALIARAKAELPPKAAYYAAIMGLYPTGITITSARTRFGSCSAKNRICFSWRLMQYPEAAIDYVVVHELAHIAHKNHGPDFHTCVAAVLPDHKARRALLKSF